MTPERWRQIEELYHAALDQAPDHRSPFLAAACEADANLREEVAALLAQAANTGDLPQFTSDDHVDDAGASHGTLAVGTQLGPYRID
jgi:methylase of polypeptide subunit release factors